MRKKRPRKFERREKKAEHLKKIREIYTINEERTEPYILETIPRLPFKNPIVVRARSLQLCNEMKEAGFFANQDNRPYAGGILYYVAKQLKEKIKEYQIADSLGVHKWTVGKRYRWIKYYVTENLICLSSEDSIR